jgi:hypothetical protein
VDNIRIDLGEVGWGDVNWIGLSQDRNRWRALFSFALFWISLKYSRLVHKLLCVVTAYKSPPPPCRDQQATFMGADTWLFPQNLDAH